MCVPAIASIADRQRRQLPLLFVLLLVTTSRWQTAHPFPLGTPSLQRQSPWRHHRPLEASPPTFSASYSSSPKSAAGGGAGPDDSGTPVNDNNKEPSPKKDNKAMQFLKKMGKVGGSANRDFRYAIGVDEGSSGKSMGDAAKGGAGAGTGGGASGPGVGVLRKSQAAYPSIVAGGGIIDDLREPFPTTTIGTSWSGFTDQVMGGHSMAVLVRNDNYLGRPANVLTGRVRPLPGQPKGGAAGFVQMATNLNGQSMSASYVDASSFDGVEVEVSCTSRTDEAEDEVFNVHLKNLACLRPFSSYRATFRVPGNGDWTTVRLPWRNFSGHGPGASESPLDVSSLVRVGIVAIGRPMEVELAVAGLKFYRS